MNSSSPPPRRPAARGFTLLELMIAVIVVGLLVAVALPSFMEALRKGRRSEAVAALADMQQAQERWRANNSSYTSSLSSDLKLGSSTPNGYYALSIDAADAVGYTITAAAASGTLQASDTACAKLRIRMNAGNISYGSACASCSDYTTATGNPCWSR